MEENKTYCDACEIEIIKETEIVYHNYKLCDECLEEYRDETGYCSLSCCAFHKCDDSC